VIDIFAFQLTIFDATDPRYSPTNPYETLVNTDGLTIEQTEAAAEIMEAAIRILILHAERMNNVNQEDGIGPGDGGGGSTRVFTERGRLEPNRRR